MTAVNAVVQKVFTNLKNSTSVGQAVVRVRVFNLNPSNYVEENRLLCTTSTADVAMPPRVYYFCYIVRYGSRLKGGKLKKILLSVYILLYVYIYVHYECFQLCTGSKIANKLKIYIYTIVLTKSRPRTV